MKQSNVDFCLDLSLSVNEFKKEIDEHKITDKKTIDALNAARGSFSRLCLGEREPVSCASLVDASEIWREEIDKYSNKIPVIRLFGWACAKGIDYYNRVQNGIDIAVKKLGCK